MDNYDHKKMIAWQSIDQLDVIVTKVLKQMPNFDFKIRSQIDNASASIGANFVEGYYSNSPKEFLRFLSYSRRSSAELYERVRRIRRREQITENLFAEFEERYYKTIYLLDQTKKYLEKNIE